MSLSSGDDDIDYRQICIVSWEVFDPHHIKTINDKVSSDMGFQPKEESKATRTDFHTFVWDNIPLKALFKQIFSIPELDERQKIALQSLVAYGEEIFIQGINDPDLPYYCLYMYFSLNKNVSTVPDFDFNILQIRNLIERYIKSLPHGVSYHRRDGSGHSSIILIDVLVDNLYLNEMARLVSLLEDDTIPEDHHISIAEQLNRLQPALSDNFTLSHTKSYFVIDESLHTIVGSIGGLIPFDSTSSYILITALEEGHRIAGFHQHIFPVTLELLYGNPWEWVGPLSMLLCIESWSYNDWSILRKHRETLSTLSEHLIGDKTHILEDKDLSQIAQLGLESSALKIDLMRLESRCDYYLDSWCKGSFGPLHETPVPFDKRMMRYGFDSKCGYLPSIAQKLEGSLQGLKKTISTFEDETNTLSAYANQIALRKSTIASEKSSQSVEFLTWLLLALTLVLVVLDIGGRINDDVEIIFIFLAILILPAFFGMKSLRKKKTLANIAVTSFSLGAMGGFALGFPVYLSSTLEVAILLYFCLTGVVAMIIMDWLIESK